MSTVLDRIPRRMYAQYADKVKLNDWLNIAKKMGGSMADAINAVRFSYDIDTAVGEQLDVIGRIVVIDRGFLNHIEIDSFQFNGQGDNECGDPNVMCSADSIATDDKMSDGLFRLLIKAKIIKNNSDATIESIIQQMILLIGAEFLRVNDTEDMEFSVEFSGADITSLQRYALFNENIIQIPQGVLFRGFTEITDVAMFGDEEMEFGNFKAEFSDLSGGPLPPTPPVPRLIARVTSTGDIRNTSTNKIRITG
ncbi:hypothetical protein CASP1_00076 [Alcaligenes phage CASP1]|nr:hypothetical protein CASP1_00076 [Alcaligenes phage CASP1]